MAFGFRREPGTGRGYVNEASGARISRRQYDKYVESIGRREHLPGVTEAARAMRDAEAAMDRLRRELAARGAALDARERELLAREAAVAAGEARQRRSVFTRVERQGKGQRRYNTALEAFMSRRKEQGRPVSRREAAKAPEFRAALAEIKGKPNPRGDPTIAAANQARRNAAVEQLGGWREFEEMYRKRHGARVVRRSGSAGQRMRRANKG